MAKGRRENDARRTVGSHEKMMTALGRAAGWDRVSNPQWTRESTKVNEQTGEVFLAIPGKAHVYDPKEAKSISERYK